MSSDVPLAPREAEASPYPRRPRARRVWWVLAAVVLVLAVGALVLPWIAAPRVERALLARLRHDLGGEAHLSALTLDWGSATLTGLSAEDGAGRTALAVERAEVHVDLLSLLTGRPAARVRLQAPLLHVARDEDGRLNVGELLGLPGERPDEPRGRERRERETDELPELALALSLTGGTLRVETQGEDGAVARTELRDLDLHVDLDQPTGPTTLTLAASLHDEHGEAGRLLLDGRLTQRADGLPAPEGLRGELQTVLTALRLSALAPALSAVGGAPVALSGQLDVSGRWSLDGPRARQGEGELRLSALHLRTPALLLELPEARLALAGEGDPALQQGRATLSLPRLQVEHAAVDAEPSGVSLVLRKGLDVQLATRAAGGEDGPAVQLELLAQAHALDLALPHGAHLREDAPRLQLAASLSPRESAVTSARLSARALSGELTGRLLHEDGAPRADGVRADLVYRPALLAPLLGDALPLQVRGDESQPLVLRLDGPLSTGPPLGERLAALSAELHAGLGTLEIAGLPVGGSVQLATGGGKDVHALAALSVAGGDVRLEAWLDPRTAGADETPAEPGGGDPRASAAGRVDEPRALASVSPPASRAELAASGVAVDDVLGGLLARLHPGLASLAAERGAGVSARADAGLALRWDGPLPLPFPPPGPARLAPLAAHGTLALHDVVLGGDGLLGQLFTVLREPPRPVLLEPLAFAVQDGRIAYEEPWPWRLGDTLTTFTGSVGFDGTLDLSWNVPVTPGLAARERVLRALEGQVLSVPLVGSLAAPRLLWQDALAALLQQGLREEVDARVRDELPGLLGGDVDPADLLERADALWEEGRRDEARPLYRRLKDEFTLTLVYQLNKDRIKDRARSR